ncbi:MAG: hypothetical protein IH944_12825 [Armatimonadetes bacterium]|nr:hypothetical protein [Armatimonadota bacterium]
MKKKWRVLAIIAGAVVLVTVGAVFYANREHPDYVRAAKLLPAARQEAEAMFGPLTWDEFRAENGIDFQDDTAAWEEVVSNIPQAVKTQYETRGPLRNERAVFLAEREWFFQVRSQVQDLRIMHVLAEDGEFWAYSFNSYTEIIKALGVGIDGAAEVGDAEAVLEIGRAANSIIAAFNEEPSFIHHLVTFALLVIIDHVILSAAVRNRSNPAMLKSLQTVLNERPPILTIREVMSADARSESIYFEQLRTMSPLKIDDWLDEYAAAARPEPPLLKIVYNASERVTGERPTLKRRTGNKTAAALEARRLEVMVRYTILFENLVNKEPDARRRINVLADRIEQTVDRSYELATYLMFSTVVYVHISYAFNEAALRSAIALLGRYPDYEDLPETLPADLSFADPFGGGSVIYRKTPRGFLIYSRSMNGTDDGYPLSDPDELGQEASMVFYLNREDAGLIVSYDPITPAP